MSKVFLNEKKLKALRQSRLMSQENLADDFRKKHIRVSIASIKRAETGKPILYRIAGALAQYYDIDVCHLLKAPDFIPEQQVNSGTP